MRYTSNFSYFHKNFHWKLWFDWTFTHKNCWYWVTICSIGQFKFK